MSAKIFLLALITILTSACWASAFTTENLPNMILVCYEGVPRAHLPAVAWFPGKALPGIVPKENGYDAFWQGRWDAAPKFSLETGVYTRLSSLIMKAAGEKESPYLVEFLYSSRHSVVRYIAPIDFQQLRNAVKSENIKGHEVMADWPLIPNLLLGAKK